MIKLLVSPERFSAVRLLGRRGRRAPEDDGWTRTRRAQDIYAQALPGARDVETIAALLVRATSELLGVELAALALVEGGVAAGVRAELDGEDVPWWRELRLTLDQEPSAIASVVFEAAPLMLYDVESSPQVKQDVSKALGVKSSLWVPLVSEEQVIAVLTAASTSSRRTFSAGEISCLEELAAETVPALARARSASALAEALAREQLVARLSRRLRAGLDLDSALSVAVAESGPALAASRCYLRLNEHGRIAMGADWSADGFAALGERAADLPEAGLAARERRTVRLEDASTAARNASEREGLAELEVGAALATPIVLDDQPIGVLGFHRPQPGAWTDADATLAEGVARELGLVLQTARLLDENERRLRQQAALLSAAQAVTSELRLETMLQRLVEEVVRLLEGDAADCWISEDDGRLRLRAVHGLPAEEVGSELVPAGTIGEALASGRPVLRRDPAHFEQSEPRAAYRSFQEVVVAPIGEGRGVLSVCSRRADHFRPGDLELLDAFGRLAALALRNAETFEERSRQARIQRGFYRIASVLGQPISLAGTLEAVVQAAREALGGDFAALFMPRRDGLVLAGSEALPATLAAALAEGLAPPQTALLDAAMEGYVLAARDVRDDERFEPEWRALAERADYRSLLAVPVGAGRDGDGTGLVLVFFAETRRFVDDDLELAQHLAGAARGALERSSLYEQERLARALAQRLAHTGGVLAGGLAPTAVLEEVAREAPRLLGVEACAIRALDGDELVVRAVGGEGLEGLLGRRSPASAWLSGEVIESRARVVVDDTREDERLVASDPILGLGYEAYLGVPLAAVEGALQGVLAVYAFRPRSWRPEEVEALLALAANASAALANAELYQRVALERERSLAILANIADGIVAVDREGRVVLWNAAAEQITGVPTRAALGRSPQEVLGRTLESDDPRASGNRLVSIPGGGEETWLSLTEAVMRDPAGEVAGRVYAFRDISADRLVEQMKSDFVSTVSQQLRRPLTSIYGFAETLLRSDVLFGEDERRTFLGYISSESERLTRIVDALLSVARLDAGNLQVVLAPTDVADVVTAVVAEAEVSGNVNGHRLVVDLPPEPLTAAADGDKLRQVLGNLVENALKFSPPGGIVTVAAWGAPDVVRIRVADDGIGIPASERQRIFRKFYRDPRAGGPSGAGLGLFIAQGLTSAMGGRISVASAEGEGASFTLELQPAARGTSEGADERV